MTTDADGRRALDGLEWLDERKIIMDDTMIFGQGYDFEGMELLREETETPLGRFMVWPDHLGNSKNWSFYGGTMGLFQQGFKTKQEAQDAVYTMVLKSSIRAALAGREWQSMESAPKDGTRVILLTKWGALEGAFNQYWARPCWSCLDSRTTADPLGWMQLPLPPAQQHNSGGSSI